MAEHEIDVIYVPVCAVCNGDVYLNDSEQWVHVIEPES
jgi:hypothetical protein